MKDHRLEDRHDARLSVELTREDRYIGRFRTRNTCARGAFVDALGTGLRRGDLVTVSFRAGGALRRRQTRLAQVVHVCPEGVGIAYSAPYSPDTDSVVPR